MGVFIVYQSRRDFLIPKNRWSNVRTKLNLITTVDHSTRKVDYVLVYQKEKNETKTQRKKTKKLQYFLRELRKEGLKIEYANLAYMKFAHNEGTRMTPFLEILMYNFRGMGFKMFFKFLGPF